MHPPTGAILADIGGLFLLPIGLSAPAFWIWMLVDCARHETGSSLLAWLLLILFVGIIGAPLYFSLRRLPRQHAIHFRPASPLYQPWRKNHRLG